MNQSEILFLWAFGIVAAGYAVTKFLFYMWPDVMLKCIAYALGAAFLYWFFTPIGELSTFLFAYLIVQEISNSKKTT